ncbi:MAG TPA: SRPBCC domain-containing protein [Rhizomicrobium sp.]|nr:SRPBCC domain-containing protein [Rhizomicrobium sp.]
MRKAELARFIDRWTVEYVRTYPHPIERVWRAITDPKEISVWFWTASFDLRVGGAFRFGPVDGDMHGVFEIVDPPRLVRFKGPFPETNPQGYMQFTLMDVPAGTRMTFVQHFTPGLVPHPELHADPADHPAAAVNPWRAGTLAGWHLAFEALGDLLDGIRQQTVTLEESEWLPVYRQHMLQTQP